MKRETFKDIEVNGRRFRIGRLDALTGSYIVTTIMMQMLPMGMDSSLPGLPEGRSMMSKETFMDIQKDCLKVVSELKSIGDSEAPILIMLPDGRWGVEDIEDDTLLVMSLTLHALMFNLSDFFQEGALDNLIPKGSALFPSSAKE